MNRLVSLGILSLLCLLAGPMVIELIRQDAGYILISVGSTTVELSFWLVALPLGLVLLRWCYKWLARILLYFGFTFRIFSSHRNKQVLKKTQRGLLHYIEGNWLAAKKDLVSVAKNSEQPLLPYLAAARSAYELGDNEASLSFLAQAEKNSPENDMSVLAGKARVQLAQQQYEEAEHNLKQALQISPSHPVMLNLIQQLYRETKNWNALIAILPKLKTSNQIGAQDFAALEVQAYKALLAEEGANKNEKELAAMWKKLPRPIRNSPSLIEQYSIMLRSSGEEDKAEVFVRQALNKQWSQSLVELYGTLKSSQLSDQMSQAEHWLSHHAEDEVLLLAAARIAMANKFWGKARGYFEASLKSKPRPDTYAELAALVAQLGDHQQSTVLYQKGLLLTTQH